MVIDHFRKTARVKMISPNDEFDIFDSIGVEEKCTEVAMVRKQVYSDLKTLVTQLSHEQREVLEMRYYGRMSFREISEECGISINTALGRMRYALINLRKLQEKHQVNLIIQ